jgi:hypothetical protein
MVNVLGGVTVAAGQTGATFYTSGGSRGYESVGGHYRRDQGRSLVFTLKVSPVLRIDTVANAASHSTDLVCSAGSLASVFGGGFTSGVEEHATTMPLPTKLSDVGVEIDHRTGRAIVCFRPVD